MNVKSEKAFIRVLFAAVCAAGAVAAAAQVRVERVATRLENPWALAFLPDQRFLVTERAGRLRVVDADGRIGEPLAGLPTIAAGGQGGLLDAQRIRT
jgi:glucose/arabinose dehydrogenase